MGRGVEKNIYNNLMSLICIMFHWTSVYLSEIMVSSTYPGCFSDLKPHRKAVVAGGYATV